jgi:4-amino-4-deoxy-L-arabinose transferase-like glycosyltransferase
MTLIIPPGMNKEQYSSLPQDEQTRRETQLQHLSPQLANDPSVNGMPAYESSQPPLYYWILACPLYLLKGSSLLTRVWIARSSSLLIGSAIIPLSFWIAAQFFNDSMAIAFTAFIALMPELAITVVRISNECLAIVLYSLLILATIIWSSRGGSYSQAVLTGTLLGLGLLTKAYFLTAIPAVMLITLWLGHKHHALRPAMVQGSLSILIVLAIAGWWYVRNYIQTGTVSGLDEAIMLKNVGIVGKMQGVFHVDWMRAFATIFESHLWYSGWSLLALPHVIYITSFAALFVLIVGTANVLVTRRDTPFFVVVSFYAFFWLGQIYQIVCLYLSKHSSTAMGGWYLYSLVTAEMVLVMVAVNSIVLRFRTAVVCFAIIGIAFIDLYAMHFIALPYYANTGVSLFETLNHLLVGKPHFITLSRLYVAWGGYLLSTITIIGIGCFGAIGRSKNLTRVQIAPNEPITRTSDVFSYNDSGYCSVGSALCPIPTSLKRSTPGEPRLLPDRTHQIAQRSLKYAAFDVRSLETWFIRPGKRNHKMRSEVPEASQLG